MTGLLMVVRRVELRIALDALLGVVLPGTRAALFVAEHPVDPGRRTIIAAAGQADRVAVAVASSHGVFLAKISGGRYSSGLAGVSCKIETGGYAI
jgi:hypothetical protein